MNEIITFSLSVFTGLFAVMNPIVSIPMFLSLVEGYSPESKIKIAKKASIIAFVILFSFIVLGKYIFLLFGITIPAFKITGGILIFYIGFEMLQSKSTRLKTAGISVSEQKDDESADSIAVSPLAIPLLCGPGTIVTSMNYVTNTSYINMLIVIVLAMLITFLNYLAFRSSELIVNRLGRNFITVIDKIMGLILAIIGTGMVIAGVKMVA